MLKYQNNTGGIITVKGLVIPVDWSETGEPVGVSISTYEEIDYAVETNGAGLELLGLVHQEVEVKGRVRVLETGENVLEVSTYRTTGRPRTGVR